MNPTIIVFLAHLYSKSSFIWSFLMSAAILQIVMEQLDSLCQL